MLTIYMLKVAELTNDFIEMLKIQFKDKEIKIVVTEADETDYLMSSSEYKEEVLSRVCDIREGKNILIPDQTKFR